MTVRLRMDSDYRRATLGRFRLALSSGDTVAFRWTRQGNFAARLEARAEDSKKTSARRSRRRP